MRYIWVLILGGLASADLVILRSGGKLEGSSREEAGQLVVTTENGTVRIPLEDVLTVTKGLSPAEEYAQKAAALQPDDVNGHWDLADWCRAQGLGRCERQELEAVIAADPEHGPARGRLGYEKVEGRWLRGEELMLAKGMVKVNGEWMTQAELEERERRREEAERREKELLEERIRELERRLAEERYANRSVYIHDPPRTYADTYPYVTWSYPRSSYFFYSHSGHHRHYWNRQRHHGHGHFRPHNRHHGHFHDRGRHRHGGHRHHRRR